MFYAMKEEKIVNIQRQIKLVSVFDTIAMVLQISKVNHAMETVTTDSKLEFFEA